MAIRTGIFMSSPTIVELIDICEQMAATSRRLFEIVGTWVADEPDHAAQRRFSIGAHRHAWHAELWEARRPAVPLDAADLDAPRVDADDVVDRTDWYDAQLGLLRDQLDALLIRVDTDLDPSTARTVSLVRADVADLLETGVDPPG